MTILWFFLFISSKLTKKKGIPTISNKVEKTYFAFFWNSYLQTIITWIIYNLPIFFKAKYFILYAFKAFMRLSCLSKISKYFSNILFRVILYIRSIWMI